MKLLKKSKHNTVKACPNSVWQQALNGNTVVVVVVVVVTVFVVTVC